MNSLGYLAGGCKLESCRAGGELTQLETGQRDPQAFPPENSCCAEGGGRPCTEVGERASGFRYPGKWTELWCGVLNATVHILNHQRREPALWSPGQIPFLPSVLGSFTFPGKVTGPPAKKPPSLPYHSLTRMAPATYAGWSPSVLGISCPGKNR